MIHYLAYGSNLHPLRLRERVPSARLIAVTQLEGYRLAFHKRGQDDSGKCNLVPTVDPGNSVHGAIYTLAHEHKRLLDDFEGCGAGYLDQEISVPCRDTRIHCFTYLAQQRHIDDTLKPYHWYKQLVIHGAQFLGFPQAYIRALDAVQSRPDRDRERVRQHTLLLQRMARHRL